VSHHSPSTIFLVPSAISSFQHVAARNACYIQSGRESNGGFNTLHRTLHIDLADAFDGADEVGVLTQQIAWIRGFHVLLGVGRAAAVLVQQTELALGEDAALASRFLFQP
jgi:hypothetical protein